MTAGAYRAARPTVRELFLRAPERALPLADEPLRGLAPLDAELVVDALRALAGRGCAIVLTGHDAPALLAAAHHVTWCTSGTTHEIGPPSASFAHDAFRREYLGPGGPAPRTPAQGATR